MFFYTVGESVKALPFVSGSLRALAGSSFWSYGRQHRNTASHFIVKKKILISFFISVMNVKAFKAAPTPCPSVPCKQRTMKQTGPTSSLHGSLGFLRRQENPSGAISKQIFPRQMPHSEKHLLFSGNVSNPSGISLL